MWFLYVFTVVVGVLNALQSGSNGTLGKTLQQPFTAALVIASVTVVSLVVAGAVSGQLGWPEPQRWGSVPWWAWIGGIFGAIFVMSQLYAAQQIGAGPYIGLIVTASVLVSLVLDHFGWMGFEQHSANIWRLLGGVLMIVGVALIAIF